MTSLELEPFSFPFWYPIFIDCSIEAISIPIPPDVQTYLKVGFFRLPKEALPAESNNIPSDYRQSILTNTEDDSEPVEYPTFPTFSGKLTDALIKLGGEVFLKLNWSSPKDAVWTTAKHTLKCTTLEEIYFLLKSSEIVDKDLSYEFKNGNTSSESQYCVVLKRWMNIDPGWEFRLFIVENKIVGISQRYCSTYYSYIEDTKDEIVEDIVNFFNSKVKYKFPIPTYTLDIVRQIRDTILILDFNPLAQELTNLLLFDWEEIHVTPDHETSETEPVNEAEDDFLKAPVLNYVGSDSYPCGKLHLSASSIHIESVLKLNLEKKRFGVLRFVVPDKKKVKNVTRPSSVQEDVQGNSLDVQQQSSISPQDDQQQPSDGEEKELSLRKNCRRKSDTCR